VSALSGKHAIVTGANRGIGAAIALALSERGATVSLLVRNRARGEEAECMLEGSHGTFVADVTDRSAVHAACTAAAERFGPVDILVNNAGSTESAPFLKSDPSLFERMIAVHLLAAVHTTQAVLPSMIARGHGHVINMASTAGLRGEAYVTAYVAAKHALVGLTRALAVEVEQHGVLVNAVCPGYTDTDLVRESMTRIAKKTGKSEHDALRTVLDRAGQSRLVTADEVAAAVVDVCMSVRNGQAIVVDGSTA
jgi:NAD(P)-dependent dehydrogenase (short-subunit alcohol dehydrogenase family)